MRNISLTSYWRPDNERLSPRCFAPFFSEEHFFFIFMMKILHYSHCCFFWDEPLNSLLLCSIFLWRTFFSPLLHHRRYCCCRWGWTAYFFWGHKSLLMSSSVICQSNPSKCQEIISNVLFQISKKRQNKTHIFWIYVFHFSINFSQKLGLKNEKLDLAWFAFSGFWRFILGGQSGNITSCLAPGSP